MKRKEREKKDRKIAQLTQMLIKKVRTECALSLTRVRPSRGIFVSKV